MEALKSLQVGTCHFSAVGSSLSRNERVTVAARKMVPFRRWGVSTSKAVKSRSVVRVSATTAESMDLSDMVKARRDIQERELKTQGFSIARIDCAKPQDWHPATVDKVEDVAPGVRCVTLIVECSRELVELDKAYIKPGQIAQVKVDDEVIEVPVSSPPFSEDVNNPVLYKIRGDIPAGMTKLAAFTLSAKAPTDLHVTEEDSPTLFNLEVGDEVEFGPWKSTGLDLRPILFLARYPTILIFAHGKGIAIARALLEARDADTGSLNLGLRKDVRLYYSAPTPSLLAYKGRYSKWAERRAVKVRTIVDDADGEDWNGYEGSFSTLWDEDDVEYDPAKTAVVIAVESSKRKQVKRLVLEDAGIPEEQVITWEV